MAFFVVERSALDSSLSVPLPDAFATREAAIAALSAAAASGAVALTGEVFIADLSSAVPVLIMPAAVPAAPEPSPVTASREPSPVAVSPRDEPSLAGEETPVEEALPDEGSPDASPAKEPLFAERSALDLETPSLDEVEASETYASWKPLAEAAQGESLADALQRAATTLESEGIVAPDSVGSVATPAVPEGGSALDESVDLLSGAAAPAPPVAQPLGLLPDPEGAADRTWPWANIDSYEIAEESPDHVESGSRAVEDGASPADVDETPPSDPEEPAGHAGRALAGDEDAAPDPVSEPDLATQLSELVDSIEEPAAEMEPNRTSAPPEGEDAHVPRPMILGDADRTTEPSAAEPLLEVPSAPEGESTDLGSSLAAADPLDAGYAVTGALDLAEYVCEDCVYSNTCPKVGQAAPADCGSFQWKSE